MSLSERSRSANFQKLSAVVDEKSIEEMLSYFPTRDVEEPVTREHLRAEFAIQRAEVQAEFAATRELLQGEVGLLRSELHGELVALRSEAHASERRLVRWMAGSSAAVIVPMIGILLGAIVTVP